MTNDYLQLFYNKHMWGNFKTMPNLHVTIGLIRNACNSARRPNQVS